MTGVVGAGFATVQLAASLNSAEASKLKAAIEVHCGRPLRLDAGNVTMIGAQCLQILLAARTFWSSGGIRFETRNLSGEMTAALGILGVPPDLIGARGGLHDT